MLQRRAVLFAALAAVAPAMAQTEGPPLPPVLDELAGLPLAAQDGAATTLGAHLGPGPTVISLWATWCGPCVAEARHLVRVRQRLGAARLNIIGVNVQRRDEAIEAEIARFLELVRPNYPQLRGDMATYRAFGGGEELRLPRLYVFAADGRPAAAFGRYDGAATFRAIDRAIARVVPD
jgi:thiol-disulfide isomerase/thioredoxin